MTNKQKDLLKETLKETAILVAIATLGASIALIELWWRGQ